jgi:acyl dehydratase
MASHLTDEIRALVGQTGPRLTAAHPLGPDELRRFTQAVMDDDPIHWDADAGARYGGVVAPLLYPVNALRRAPGSADPLDRLHGDPDWDGTDLGSGLGGLPPVRVPGLPRVLNGGVEAEFHQMARVGDVISAQASYLDISERAGKSGPMVILTVETTYTNQDDAVLVRARSTVIMR